MLEAILLPVAVLEMGIRDRVIATSGAYERYFEYEGTVYHHIIDPATGYPAETDLLSVTVLSDDGALADCLSTTFFIEGRDAALEVVRRQAAGEETGFELILVDKEGNIYISPSLSSSVSLAAVSYTHLDVYKRQAISGVSRLRTQSAMVFQSSGRRFSLKMVSGEAVTNSTSSSRSSR